MRNRPCGADYSRKYINMRFKLNPVRKVATMMHWCWLMDIFERKYICSVFVRVLLWFGIHCSTLCASIICVVVSVCFGV